MDRVDVVVLEQVSGGSSLRGVTNEGTEDLQSEDILAVPRSRSESQGQSDIVGISVVSEFTTSIFRSFSGVSLSFNSGDEGELRFDEVNEFLMVFNTSSADGDSVGVNILKLELLDDVVGEVFNVVW